MLNYTLNLIVYLLLTIIPFTSPAAEVNDLHIIKTILSDNNSNLEQLLNAGANPDARAEYGVTALMISINKYNNNAAKMLIKKGADVNATDIAGVTPLHLAARNGNLEMVKILVEAGADINAKDKYGMTALSKATAAHRNKIVDFLMNIGSKEHQSNNLVAVKPSQVIDETTHDAVKTEVVTVQTYKETPKIQVKEKTKYIKIDNPVKIETKKEDKKVIEAAKNNNAAPVINAKNEDSIVDLEWLKSSPKVHHNHRIAKAEHKEANSKHHEAKANDALHVPAKDMIQPNSNKSTKTKPTETKVADNETKEQLEDEQPKKQRKKIIRVGRAKFVNEPPRLKYTLKYAEDFTDSNAANKIYWLAITPHSQNNISDLIFKAIHKIQNYRIKYVAVQNLKTQEKFIKAGPMANKDNAFTLCQRVLDDSTNFKDCKVTTYH